MIADRFPLKVTHKTFELINNGCSYICGRDRLYRPIVVTRPAVYNNMPHPQPTVNETLAAIIMTHFFIRKHMFCPGHVENVVQIMDLSGNSVVPWGLMKEIIMFMPKLNKGRVRTFYVINCPTSVKYIWATVRYFVDENTQNKVQFSNSNSLPDLLKLVSPE